MIAVLDYGMGNLRSVEKALAHVGATATVTSDAARVREAEGVILPGVGAFPKAMERIRERGLDELVRERVDAGVPVLGICLGLQLLCESSTELGGAEGLGLVDGRVDRLAADGLKLPQIGWNAVGWARPSPLVDDLPDPCAMYHVHTYAVRTGDALGTATYGEEFVSAVERDSIYGVQFHPEKSGRHGLRLLSNFTRICAAA
ncbi:MAG: imidazole glycerol-phosphate synthase subunit HisH [Thermoleophilaceae bacterium]|nr:imidazole glycerol-phosphate synthase subunit HisH [Thermoleophilaceae bacterium]MEA2350942.1 imidazole glycerol-phosphate synthase subunit HisH [Thermoleophilaceae bacterium]MEA2353773.1 imidazole glycerol-phosphate synthase subunit HisH [Thermoleophilaceae bacterium]MEA2367685.1 imidazole glycerol-phosphate synthase subunit HisH [Thermoleophilaceae bacterium]MEA2387246.1 imidazole glycerol-phosphate synthase subunit HisH [Thermoleophilaceae bacterium]